MVMVEVMGAMVVVMVQVMGVMGAMVMAEVMG